MLGLYSCAPPMHASVVEHGIWARVSRMRLAVAEGAVSSVCAEFNAIAVI